MVSRQARERKAIMALCIVLSALFVVFIINVVAVTVMMREREATKNSTSVEFSEDYSEYEDFGEYEDDIVLPSRIDFQRTVDEFVSSTGGAKGVIIYDLDLGEVVGEYQADEVFSTASLYKLFVVYEGYRRVSSGTWDGGMVADYKGRTITECLDAAIRSSDSVCAEALWDRIGHAEIVRIIREDFGISIGDSILKATPRQITTMMKLFYEMGVSSETEQMWDSFLNQPTTEYNWRQGLPSGFTDAAKVYNKVGWSWVSDEDGKNGYWEIYDDAAIVEFPEEGRHFIVVVMTSRVRYQAIRDFGASLEAKFNADFAELLTALPSENNRGEEEK